MLLDGLIPDRFMDSINDDGNYDISIIKLNRYKKDSFDYYANVIKTNGEEY